MHDAQAVVLESGERLPYDQLIIATGTVPRPDLVPGMEDGSLWYDKVFDFYTLKGAEGLRRSRFCSVVYARAFALAWVL